MAVTITRTAWTDDDGSGTTGTVINNAVKTELYGQIDAALALLLPLAGGTLVGDLKFTDASFDIGKSGATRPRDLFLSRNAVIGGTLGVTGILTVNGFGTNSVSGSGTGAQTLLVANTNAGSTTDTAGVQFNVDAGGLSTTFKQFSASFTTAGANIAGASQWLSGGAGGLVLVAVNGAGPVQTYAGGTTLRNQTLATGHFVPGADNTYNLGTTGTMRWKDIFAVTKTSSLDVSWGSRSVLVSVLEGPEYRLYDSGAVRLDAAGQATIALDPKFVEVANLALPYQVLTGGARVVAKTATGFTLHGQPNDDIDYLVLGVRAGFENVRWRDPLTETAEPLGLQDPWAATTRKHAANNTPTERPRRAAHHLPSWGGLPSPRQGE